MSDWYVVHCKSGCERVAMEHLARQEYEVYCPTIAKKIRGESHNKLEVLIMFPRYIFIRCKNNEINSMAINSTRGVARLISFGGMNPSISDSSISEIKEKEAYLKDQSDNVESSEVHRKLISKIKFNSFSEIPKEVFSLDEKRRAQILLSILESRQLDIGRERLKRY